MEYERPSRSHIREDGSPKIPFFTEEGAVAHANDLWNRTRKPHCAYLCEQKPDHWHVGRGVPDLPKEHWTKRWK